MKLALAAHQPLSKVARRRAIAVSCTVNQAGRCAVSATITADQARKVHLPVKGGAEHVTLGEASALLRQAGQTTVRVRLSRKTAAALRYTRTLVVVLTATATDGTGRRDTITRRAKLRAEHRVTTPPRIDRHLPS